MSTEPVTVNANRYLPLWLPAIGLHALHQVEESIGFFAWYADNAAAIPQWARIIGVAHAQIAVAHPAYFVAASLAQILAVALIAFAFRRRETVTRYLLLLYIAGITFFLVWHIVVAWLAQSYAPIMVTCIGGLYLIPRWVRTLLAR